MKPIRVQRKRSKGWKMPPNTVYVGRPTRWGNPWISIFPEVAVKGFALTMSNSNAMRQAARNELRGKNLACWCRLDQPCHADVLLKIANEEEK